MKKISAVMLAGMMAASLAACGNSETAETAATTAATTAAQAEDTTNAETESQETTANAESADVAPADLSGSITMVGSTSMEKFANSLSEAFMEKYPDVTVTAEFTGSSAGIEAAANLSLIHI